jgi:glycosyltransferase involved in cell wall biosynthesis
VILRVPAVLAPILHAQLTGERRPYAVEVVGDPDQIFAPGALSHPLRPLLRRLLARQQRAQCLGAVAAGYVTRGVLQRIYPPSATALSTNYSSIELDPAAFAGAPRQGPKSPGTRRIVAVGSLEQLYKGPDVLIAAVSRLLARGMDARMVWLGDGALRSMLEQKVSALGLADRIRFAGELLPGDPVRQEIDRADLFVMASRSEGLPRALIEAMSRAVPCVGTHVGGIPELLAPDDMVAPGDSAALAETIARVLSDPARMARMSARNLETAAEYRADLLRARRIVLYRHLRERTAAWAQARSAIVGEPATLTT